MLTKICPSCGGRAEMHDHHIAHDIHVGHAIHEFIHRNPFFRSHPALAAVGTAGLGIAAVVKFFEKHDYRCVNGHHFKA